VELKDMKEQNKKAIQDYKEGIPVNLDTLQNSRWGLIRKRDNLSKYSEEIGFIEYDEDGHFKEIFKGIEGLKIGRSLILSPFTVSYTWQTTSITEILESEEGDNIRFKTENSNYTLIDFEQDEEEKQ
jgi:hypothetical protein|tara:strand:+ start:1072 stop:1452 length:381 start_codon:yes stop_codon:yes gene_type:complete